MFDYSLVTNLFLKRGIRKYVKSSSIDIGSIIICLSCINNYYKYNSIVCKCIGMLFNVEPLHIYIYLYYAIPKHNKMPYAKKVRKMKYDLPKEYEELGNYFGWSKQETYRNRKIFDLMYNKAELKKSLGVK